MKRHPERSIAVREVCLHSYIFKLLRIYFLPHNDTISSYLDEVLHSPIHSVLVTVLVLKYFCCF